jgi:hypothetical protein
MLRSVVVAVFSIVFVLPWTYSQAKLTSTVGHFTLYVPSPDGALGEAQAAKNKNLFSLMEAQVKHRPVMVSFDADGGIPEGFLEWMLSVYGSDLFNYRGQIGENDVAEMTASYFLDRAEDNDFVIDVRSRYSTKMGMEILVMTYEYFRATH